MTKQLVLMDHDGGVDDYLATMLLLTMDNVQLMGVVDLNLDECEQMMSEFVQTNPELWNEDIGN